MHCKNICWESRQLKVIDMATENLFHLENLLEKVILTKKLVNYSLTCGIQYSTVLNALYGCLAENPTKVRILSFDYQTHKQQGKIISFQTCQSLINS